MDAPFTNANCFSPEATSKLNKGIRLQEVSSKQQFEQNKLNI